MKEADPELERLLAEEEEIERRTVSHHETPKFHPGTADCMLMPKKVKHRKQQRGRMQGSQQGRHRGHLRRLRHPGPRARVDHRSPDRGRSNRHDPPHPPWRQGVDHRLPGQARHGEARRDPHGLRQGQPRAVGGRREAGPHPVRAVLPRPGAGPRGHRPGHPEAADQGALHRTGGGASDGQGPRVPQTSTTPRSCRSSPR